MTSNASSNDNNDNNNQHEVDTMNDDELSLVVDLEDVSLSDQDDDEENSASTTKAHFFASTNSSISSITATTTTATTSPPPHAGGGGVVLSLPQQRRADWKAARAAAASQHHDCHPFSYCKQPFGFFGMLHYARGLHRDVRYCRYLERERAQQHCRVSAHSSSANGPSNNNEAATIQPVLSWEAFHHQQQQRRPYFTYALLLICTAVLLASLVVSGGFERGNFLLGPDRATLLHLGGLSSQWLLHSGEWYRLVAAVALHGGLVHWAANAVFVLALGPTLERLHGSLVAGTLFVGTAVAANLVVALLSPFAAVSVGCSGGVCAWLGVCATEGLLHWPHLDGGDNSNNNHSTGCTATKVKAVVWLLADIAALVVFGWLPWVDNVAHCFGLLLGACWAAVAVPTAGVSSFLLLPQRHQGLHRCLRGGAALLATAVTLLALWSLAAIRLDGGDIGDLPCRHYCQTVLSCAPWQYDTCGDPCQTALVGYQGSLTTVHDDDESSSSGGSTTGFLLTAQLHCPYGDVADFVTRIDAIDDGRQDDAVMMMDPEPSIDWTQLCRTYCDL